MCQEVKFLERALKRSESFSPNGVGDLKSYKMVIFYDKLTVDHDLKHSFGNTAD